MEKAKEFSVEELIKKYKIDIPALEAEQKKLAKTLEIKDSIDFSLVQSISAIENSFTGNKIISAVVLLTPEMEINDQQYFSDILRFPYLPGFRAYRELPAMINAFQKLEEKPDVVFIHGHGISHPRLGLASHFSISTGIPTIGVTDELLQGSSCQGEDIILNNKKVGKVLQSKQGSKPLYISPGNLISIKTAYELAKKYIMPPHKFPEPLHIANKYSREVRDELFSSKPKENIDK